MTQARKHRGMRSQLVVARWFAARGWPHATSTGAGRSGVDIENMAALAPEVKARRNLNIVGFLKQAVTQREHGLPFVVVRPDGLGEANLGAWAVLVRLDDFTELLLDAGYGDRSVSTLDTNTTQASE